MGTKYSSILTGGVVATYNDDPPSDDGSQIEANRVKYSTVTGDLTAPLHSAHQNADGNLIAHFDEGPLTKSANYTTGASDYNTVIECTGSPDITLLAPATAGKGYRVTVKNAGSGTVEVDISGGGNIDGNSCYKLGPEQSGTFFVNDAETGYYTKHTGMEFPYDTSMVFYQASAPVGWTINTSLDEHMLRVTDSVGGTTGGVYDFEDIFASIVTGSVEPVLAVTSITCNAVDGGTAYVTVAQAQHFLLGGEYVRIEGANESEYNGIRGPIVFTGPNTFNYPINCVTSPATGTITWQKLTQGVIPTVLTGAQSGVADHTHTTNGQTSIDNTGNIMAGTSSGVGATIVSGGVTGGAQDAAEAHTHNLDIRCKWAAVIVATKDGDCGGGGPS